MSVARLSAYVFLTIGFLPSIAAAQPSPSCRRLSARAASEAALLFAPEVSLAALRIPGVGDTTGAGTFQGRGFQVRGALSWSPLDALRGAWVLETADRECRRVEARARLAAALASGAVLGKLEALGEQLTYLEAQTPRVRAIVQAGIDRRAAEVSTAAQLRALRLRAAVLERRQLAVRAERDALLDAADEEASRDLRADLATYEEATMAMEGRRSALRRLTPWQVQMRGGVIPTEPVDWYGAVELRVDLGTIAQAGAEDAYLAARVDELEESRNELRASVERQERAIARSVRELAEGLELLDAQIELLDQQRALLTEAAAETGAAHHALALTELNRIELEGERRYQARLLAERRAHLHEGSAS